MAVRASGRAALGALVLLAAGCGQRPTAQPSTPPVAATPSPSVADQLTGYGATRATWERLHRLDPFQPSGVRWDPDPALGIDAERNGTPTDTYKTAFDGPILTLDIRMRPGTSLVGAQDRVRSLLPADAVVAAELRSATCLQQLITSGTLGRESGRPGSAVDAVFYSSTAEPPRAFAPGSVAEILLLASAVTARLSPAGCG